MSSTQKPPTGSQSKSLVQDPNQEYRIKNYMIGTSFAL